MIISNLFKTIIMAFDTGTNQAETDTPLITEDDYGKPLLPVHLKTEWQRTHFFEPIHPLKHIVCIRHNCPLCDAEIPHDTERLLPVYSMGDKMVKILRIPLEIHLSSLYNAMRLFLRGKALDLGSFYRTPFEILFEGYSDGRINPYELEKDALFSVQPKEPLQGGKDLEARDDCVSGFLKEYKDGDLTKSANIHVSRKVMKMSLKNNPEKGQELADIADFMDSMPEIRAKPKRTGIFF